MALDNINISTPKGGDSYLDFTWAFEGALKVRDRIRANDWDPHLIVEIAYWIGAAGEALGETDNGDIVEAFYTVRNLGAHDTRAAMTATAPASDEYVHITGWSTTETTWMPIDDRLSKKQRKHSRATAYRNHLEYKPVPETIARAIGMLSKYDSELNYQLRRQNWAIETTEGHFIRFIEPDNTRRDVEDKR